jgi:NADH:ubiquinone oxidoreductase subunit 3 (subunit A)
MTPLAQSAGSLSPGFGPILFLILVALGIAAAIMLISHVPLKLHRTGRIKESTYESGMVPIGDARRRFNVRFYLVAMLFLLFDVELVFMYPWAMVFFRSAKPGASADWAAPYIGNAGLSGFLFAEMAVFFIILLVGYVYAWRKGVFRWD